MRMSELEAVVESLLFISGEAVPLETMAKTIDLDNGTTRAIILELQEKYETEKRGMRIIEVGDAFQMATAPDCFQYIRNMYQSPVKKGLSQAVLETLAIIAYKQPVTRSIIEDIRGVSAGHTINKLIEKELVCEVGRDNTPGKPILLGTTQEFLRYFGFQNMEQLPKLPDKTEQDLDKDEILNISAEGINKEKKYE